MNKYKKLKIKVLKIPIIVNIKNITKMVACVELNQKLFEVFSRASKYPDPFEYLTHKLKPHYLPIERFIIE